MDAPGVVPYDPFWVLQFEGIRRSVDRALLGLDHRTEHVGSTAMPGVAAKPIIDVDVVLPSADLVPAATEALIGLGYHYEGDLGIVGREAFSAPPGQPHHLYVVVCSSQPHLDHIRLRDFLRAHPGHAQRYAELKESLAPLLRTDRDAYVDGKRELIHELLALAVACQSITVGQHRPC
ncbi:GrpB family protein [soil metagenome]